MLTVIMYVREADTPKGAPHTCNVDLILHITPLVTVYCDLKFVLT